MIKTIHLTALIVLLGIANTSIAGGKLQKALDPARDHQQTLQARRLLLQDPDLASLNLGVMVQNRVATLWGPAPSAEVAFRAELCLKSMVELAEVRNELIVSEWTEPSRRPLKFETPAPKLPELLPPVLPKDVQMKPRSPGVLTGQGSGNVKLPTAQTAGHAKKLTQNETVVQPATPVSVASSDLTAAVRSLLLRSSEYTGVQFTVQGGRVYVRSRDANQSDILQEAARAIARLPNVEGVVVLDHRDVNVRD